MEPSEQPDESLLYIPGGLLLGWLGLRGLSPVEASSSLETASQLGTVTATAGHIVLVACNSGISLFTIHPLISQVREATISATLSTSLSSVPFSHSPFLSPEIEIHRLRSRRRRPRRGDGRGRRRKEGRKRRAGGRRANAGHEMPNGEMRRAGPLSGVTQGGQVEWRLRQSAYGLQRAARAIAGRFL